MKTKRDNVALTSGAVGIGGTPAKVRTNAVVNSNIAGRTVQKAATDDLWTLAGTALAANQVCAFFLLLDAAGAATVSQSAIKPASTNAVGYQANAFEWPGEDALKVCVGAVLVNSGGSAFTPGTTSLAGGGVATYINVTDDLGVPIKY